MTPPLPDADTCYRAVSSRDARFDGRFVLAVRSTGIYCRPSCPARTPGPAQCRYFATSAAAHAAGFRACKRCLPEAIPGSPEWRVREDVAARAMRLIGEGVVDREGVPGLATRLGYSSRQLTRILVEELGAPPLALARAQRASTARQLLVATDLPVADVAFAAGFASIRQFNDTIGEVFDLTPTRVRERARRAERTDASPGADGGAAQLTVRLPARAPFDGAGVLAWLSDRVLPGVETVVDGAYSRSLALAGGPAVMTARPGDAHLEVTAHLTALADLPELLARARRLFDLDADAQAIDHALATASGVGPALAPSIAATPGVRIPGTGDATEMVVRAVLGQQVTVKSAIGAVGRVATALGPALPPGLAGAVPGITRLFPDAATLAARAGEDGVVTGPGSRRAALVAASEAVAAGDIPLHAGAAREDLTAALEAIKGVGPWTSQYVAMRVLGSPDLLLTGDVALRAGARALGLPDAPRDLTEALAPVRPWRTYAMLHLWSAALAAARTPKES